jgi:hypothetical protein
MRSEDLRGEGRRSCDVLLPFLPALTRCQRTWVISNGAGSGEAQTKSLPHSRKLQHLPYPETGRVVDAVEFGENLPGSAKGGGDPAERLATFDLVG